MLGQRKEYAVTTVRAACNGDSMVVGIIVSHVEVRRLVTGFVENPKLEYVDYYPSLLVKCRRNSVPILTNPGLDQRPEDIGVRSICIVMMMFCPRYMQFRKSFTFKLESSLLLSFIHRQNFLSSPIWPKKKRVTKQIIIT